ncbi:uncharacterized protein PFL1_03312 [Pseudozyma flocculosa PF-1]|uniref:Uncharacterized protein n=2 Tax=Pseudozyma flocculosa TaxID=84751 RepID=A0A5C3F7I5_9BASI|nr:uncharacterized protein PFL1_03312 [Pseudozyma flocculosa PF-1]EPQ29022.1 hypothetical protein PFL1_03312 [Pseudozyma flocculosa PF-1]SPO40016.1 uncharacterized protein PSFLO_05498 [Pseudozyma flocculosa]
MSAPAAAMAGDTEATATTSLAPCTSIDKTQPPLPPSTVQDMPDADKPSVRRSTSSNLGRGLLKRLASHSSSRSKGDDNPSRLSGENKTAAGNTDRRASQPPPSAASHHRLTKAELAELSRPRGKYKSGVRWDQYDVPEPFMEVSASAAAQEGSAALQEGLVANAMLSSASTAAAQAYAENRVLAEPIFSTVSGAASPPAEADARNAVGVPSVDQTLAAVTQSGVTAGILSERTSPAPAAQRSPSTKAGDPISATGTTTSSQRASPDQQLVSEAAQRVLAAARKQARIAQSKQGLSVPASPLTQHAPNLSAADKNVVSQEPSSSTAAPTNSGDHLAAAHLSADEQVAVKPGRGKSLIGTIKDKGGRKPRSRKNSLSSRPNDGASVSSSPEPNASSPPNTIGRRRRFNDTRDLDLLAYELAAEALASGLPQPPFARGSRSGSSTPRSLGHGHGSSDDRRRSFHSVGSGSEHTSNTSQASLANLMMQPMTQINPVQRSREASFSGLSAPSTNGTPSHSVPASPPLMPSDAMRPDRNGFSAPSPYLNQAANLMPADMLTGLGGSPYPSLSSRKARDPLDGIDNLDPFGIPLVHESPFDATSAYANRTNVYHTPTQVAHARGRVGAANERRSVLQMKLHDPETELQGLTKVPKGKKLTPFGSRAGSRASSRAPSPSASDTNLRATAAAQADTPAAKRKVAQAAKPSGVSSPRSRMPSVADMDRHSANNRPSFDNKAASAVVPRHTSPAESESQVATPRAEAPPPPPIDARSGTNSQLSNEAHPELEGRSTELQPISALSVPTNVNGSKPRSQSGATSNLPPPSKSSNRLSGIFGFGRKKKEDPAPPQLPLAPPQADAAKQMSKATASARSADTEETGDVVVMPSEQGSLPPRAEPPTFSHLRVDAGTSASRSLPTATSGEATPEVQGITMPSAPEDEARSQSAVESVPSSLLAPAPVPPRLSSASKPSSATASSSERLEAGRMSESSSRNVTTKAQKEDDKNGGYNLNASAASKPSDSAGGGNVRRFLRRLSSFGASSARTSDGSSAAKKNSAKANFPDASTMPKLDREQLVKAGIIPAPPTSDVTGADAAVPKHDAVLAASLAAVHSNDTDPSTDRREREGLLDAQRPRPSNANAKPVEAMLRNPDDASLPTETRAGPAPPVYEPAALSDGIQAAAEQQEATLMPSAPDAAPSMASEQVERAVAINSSMAKAGFGTRSATVFRQPPSDEQLRTEAATSQLPTDELEARMHQLAPPSARSDSRTPSLEVPTLLDNETPPPLQPGEVITPASSAGSLVPAQAADEATPNKPTYRSEPSTTASAVW